MIFFIVHLASCILYLFYRFMMVCYDDVNPFFLCASSRVKRCYSAVNSDYEGCSKSLCLLHSDRIKTVSMSNSVGDKIMDVYSGCPERMNHYRGCGKPVSIIIAMNKDSFVSISSVFYSLNRSFYAVNFKGV